MGNPVFPPPVLVVEQRVLETTPLPSGIIPPSGGEITPVPLAKTQPSIVTGLVRLSDPLADGEADTAPKGVVLSPDLSQDPFLPPLSEDKPNTPPGKISAGLRTTSGTYPSSLSPFVTSVLSTSGVYRVAKSQAHWPKVECPIQTLMINEIIDEIVKKIESDSGNEHPYYLATLYQYAKHGEYKNDRLYAKKKLEELAKKNRRAQDYVRALELPLRLLQKPF